MPSDGVWRIAVDTGGTFTDCLAVDPEGRRHGAKVLSSSALRRTVRDRPSAREVEVAGSEALPEGFFTGWSLLAPGSSIEIAGSLGNRIELTRPAALTAGAEVTLQSPEEAAVLAIRLATATPPGRSLPSVALRLATTRGTNALLERKGAKVALFTTRGFADLLEIGNQQRPDLFALEVRKPGPLHATVVEVDERLDAAGAVVRELDESSLGAAAEELVRSGFRSAAVAFLHSFCNPAHENRAARVLSESGFRHISRSSELSRRIKIVPRAQTALVDAYLAEILERYLTRIAASLRPRSLHVMTSAGGLVSAAEYRPKDSLLSGPAAGVVGAVAAAGRSGFERIIAFDMGGTSTDVSRFDGELELRAETTVGPARLLSPSVAVESVAAGGGSICRWQGDRVRVGPESAGARPGPACYGDGGPLTLTDVNLLLGRLVPSRFPFRVDSGAAARRARELEEAASSAGLPADPGAGRSEAERGTAPSLDALLAGFLAIANERMAGAVRAISIRQGYDPSEYTLVAFGGAGAQHAAAIADLLGVRTVLIPAQGALLSAAGLSVARLERRVERQVLEPVAIAAESLRDIFEAMRAEATAELGAEGLAESGIEAGPRVAFLRYQGQESTLAVDWRGGSSAGELVERFESAYLDRYGYLPEGGTPEVESLRLSMRSAGEPGEPDAARSRAEPGRDRRRGSLLQRFYDGAVWVEAPVSERSTLDPGEKLVGPGLVAESHTVTVVEKGWSAHVDGFGGLVLEREG